MSRKLATEVFDNGITWHMKDDNQGGVKTDIWVPEGDNKTSHYVYNDNWKLLHHSVRSNDNKSDRVTYVDKKDKR